MKKAISRSHLRADCNNCFGLCCTALYFAASEGFPKDKEAGKPCHYLQTDFLCRIHADLREQSLKGCIAYDCLGAGQKVAQIYGGQDWRKAPESAQEMFEVFLLMWQLHEMLWYLAEGLTLEPARLIHAKLYNVLEKISGLTFLRPESLLELDVTSLRAEVNTLLLKVSELVRNAERCKQKIPQRRQKNFKRGADLSQSIFLTQGQINAARGDNSTKLPFPLSRPILWEGCN